MSFWAVGPKDRLRIEAPPEGVDDMPFWYDGKCYVGVSMS